MSGESIFMLILGAIFTLFGICMIIYKYAIIIGGTRIKAVVVDPGLADDRALGSICTIGRPTPHFQNCVYGFYYNGSYLTKRANNSRLGGPLPAGSWRYVYYNPKYPDHVVRISLGATILYILMIASGLALVISHLYLAFFA